MGAHTPLGPTIYPQHLVRLSPNCQCPTGPVSALSNTYRHQPRPVSFNPAPATHPQRRRQLVPLQRPQPAVHLVQPPRQPLARRGHVVRLRLLLLFLLLLLLPRTACGSAPVGTSAAGLHGPAFVGFVVNVKVVVAVGGAVGPVPTRGSAGHVLQRRQQHGDVQQVAGAQRAAAALQLVAGGGQQPRQRQTSRQVARHREQLRNKANREHMVMLLLCLRVHWWLGEIQMHSEHKARRRQGMYRSELYGV